MRKTTDQAILEETLRNSESPGDGRGAIPKLNHDPILSLARQRLQSTAYSDVRSITCEHHEGILVLRGHVSRYFYKQVAQESVRDLPGVEMILNAVEVIVPRGGA